jgi:hypothetical protein
MLAIDKFWAYILLKFSKEFLTNLCGTGQKKVFFD